MTKFPSDSDEAPSEASDRIVNVADFNSRALAKKARKRPAESGAALVTEDSAARRFADLYNDQLRYCHSTGAWFEWNGQRWSQNQLGKAFHFARELARKMVESEPDKVRFIASKASFAGSVERYARQDPIFAVTANYWDRNPMLLGTPGGTVDLRTGVLRPGDPADGISKSTLVAPAETAGCPLWLRFLDEATGSDAGMIRFLQQWFGYCLTGSTEEQQLVFAYGGGGAGKGTLINTVSKILGDYAVVAAMETFVASRFDRHPTELAMLRGARLVTASETEKGRQWAEAKIKQLTGSDPITAHFMRQDNFTYIPEFKLTFIGNHRPGLSTVDDAMRRRINIAPFTRKPAAPDPALGAKLIGEAPEILRWMIDGCLDWKKNRLVRPETITVETADYFSGQDLMAQWLEDECDAEAGNDHKWEASGLLFSAWAAYLARAGEKPQTSMTFAEEMAKRGFVKKRKNDGVRWLGVCLKKQSTYGQED